MSWPRRSARAGLRFGVYYSGGLRLDASTTDPIGIDRRHARRDPARRLPGYAEAQVRELIERYRPCVLWNDIAWPTRGQARSGRLLADYYDAVPDGVVNDRWMPWSPVVAAVLARGRRGRVDRPPAASSARRGPRARAARAAALRRPRRRSTPSFDDDPDASRGSACAAWTRASATTGAPRPTTSSRGDELLWCSSTSRRKNGNLLLNVGPRGEDAQIPERQLDRLRWLEEFMTFASGALYGTRPWLTPGGATGDGAEVRYTARDRDVFVFVRPSDANAKVDAVTLPEMSMSASSRVERLDGGDALVTATDRATELRLDPPAGPDVPAVLRLTDAVAAVTAGDN